MGTTLMGKEIGRGRRERPTEVGRRGWRAGKIAETGDGSGGRIQEGCRFGSQRGVSGEIRGGRGCRIDDGWMRDTGRIHDGERGREG